MSKDTALDSRLACIAAMVQPCQLAVDVGTDHGYLICELVKTGKCNRGIATDINPQPLDKARGLVATLGLGAVVETRLTDGLTGVDPQADAIVIAGMGGELVAHIIESWPHHTLPGKRFYLQPMSRAELLREWLWQRGFALLQEQCCVAAGRPYSVLEAVYTGQKIDYAPVDFWLGAIDPQAGEAAHAYCQRLAARLQKQAAGLAAGRQTPLTQARQQLLEQVVGEIVRRMTPCK